MSDDYGLALVKAEEAAKRAEVPILQFMKSIIEYKKDLLELEKSRKADDEEKTRVDAYLASLNGQLSEDLTPSDICAAAGVRQIQGTRSYARYQVKQLLLEHKK